MITGLYWHSEGICCSHLQFIMCSSVTDTIIVALSAFPDSGLTIKMYVLNMLRNSWIHFIISLWMNIRNTVLLRMACILLLFLSSCLVILIYVTAWYHSGKFWKLGPKTVNNVLLFVHLMRSYERSISVCVRLWRYWEWVWGGGVEKVETWLFGDLEREVHYYVILHQVQNLKWYQCC